MSDTRKVLERLKGMVEMSGKFSPSHTISIITDAIHTELSRLDVTSKESCHEEMEGEPHGSLADHHREIMHDYTKDYSDEAEGDLSSAKVGFEVSDQINTPILVETPDGKMHSPESSDEAEGEEAREAAFDQMHKELTTCIGIVVIDGEDHINRSDTLSLFHDLILRGFLPIPDPAPPEDLREKVRFVYDQLMDKPWSRQMDIAIDILEVHYPFLTEPDSAEEKVCECAKPIPISILNYCKNCGKAIPDHPDKGESE